MTTLHLLSRRRLIWATAGILLPAAAVAEEAGHAVAPAAHKRVARPAVAPPAEPQAMAAHAPAPPSVPPSEAMERLIAGNQRFVAGFPRHDRVDAARRQQVAAGQSPFASILACADSRVAPEILFDQGLGDLFVARVAGNVVDDAVLASLEYSVIHLGSTLIMTLGHERCGAVKATVEALEGRGAPEDKDTKIGALAALIAPAVRAVPAGAGDRVDAALSINAARAAAEIFAGSPPLRERVLAGKLKIVAARYDLDDGTVRPATG